MKDKALNLDSNVVIYIISSTFYKDISERQIKSSSDILKKELGIPDKQIIVIRTFGSLELPYLVNKVCSKNSPDGIIALGCIIEGETNHYEVISKSIFNNLVQVSVKSDIPVVSGILTVKNKDQAIDRSSGGLKDRAIEAAESLVDLLRTAREI
ncbi:MAG: 6,7-dimethyl-8-ribityllumazine synthase [Thermodesulfobacteriota bacterium]|tara:strand:+ start:486 stop:947 length:462 start_codon:yes stop_codon:yes gene_type:complete